MKLCNVQDLDHAEMLAVLLGIGLAKRYGLGVFSVECDSTNAISRLSFQGTDLSLWGTLTRIFNKGYKTFSLLDSQELFRARIVLLIN